MELIALYVHPKNSNHLRSHLRAIMALDQSRLGLENNFLENKSGRFFCVRQVYVIKSCQTNLIAWNYPFIFFIHHIWAETVYYEALFLPYRPQTECAQLLYFTILQDKLHSFNIQDDRSSRGLLARAFKNFQNHLIRPAGSHFLTSAKFAVWVVKCLHINRVSFQHNIEFIMFIFLFNGCITMFNLKSVWYARHFEYSWKRCSRTTESKRHSD